MSSKWATSARNSSVASSGRTKTQNGCGRGFNNDEEIMSDLMKDAFSHNPTWCHASWALIQIRQKKAEGFWPSIWVRKILQKVLFNLGCFTQTFAWPVTIVGFLILAFWAIGLSEVVIETNIENLWVAKGGRLDRERTLLKQLTSYRYSSASDLSDSSNSSFDLAHNQSHKIESPSDSLSMDYQVLIQTPLEGHGANILNRADLLLHVDMMLNITLMEIEMFNTTWRFDDLCFKSDPPKLGGEFGSLIDEMLGRIIPCVIVTPLDCFWEGSKPLGPFPAVQLPPGIRSFLMGGLPEQVSWMNMNPGGLINTLEELGILDFLPGVAELFNRTGMWDAYQKKSCLNPWDPDCPETAPNYRQSALNIASVMNNSCRGFAAKVMQWPEQLILGGIHRNGPELSRAEAIESVMLVASAGDLYKRFVNKTRKNDKPWDYSQWSEKAAKDILVAWQRNFSEMIFVNAFNENLELRRTYFEEHNVLKQTAEGGLLGNETVNTSAVSQVDRVVRRKDQTGIGQLLRRTVSVPQMFHPLSPTAINDMLVEFSKFNLKEIIIGYFIMVVYVSATLIRFKSYGIYSAVGLAFFGCFLVTLAEVAGLGFSTAIGIQFNAATTQIVPFLTLGLGVDDMILLACHYVDITKICHENEIGHLLKETGLLVLLTQISNVVSFFIGTIVPVPALRAFCLQVAILLIFNVIALITVFPAMMAIDLIRRRSRRMDIFCCLKIEGDKIAPIEKSTSTSVTHKVKPDDDASLWQKIRQIDYKKLSLYHFVNYTYVPFILKRPVKIAILVFFGCLLSIGAILSSRIKMGLEVTDIVPKHTAPYDFLVTREAYFSFYSANLVLHGDIDYPHKQTLIHQYREDVKNIPYYVVRDGTLGNLYWLQLMRDWLKGIQSAFIDDWHAGKIDSRGFKCDSGDYLASDEAIIAYRLLVSHGDRVNRSRAETEKLVNDEGIITGDLFWNALTAWVHIDQVYYYISQSNMVPLPWPSWSYEKGNCKRNMTDDMLIIPAAEPLKMSLMPMFLTGLTDTTAIVDMIEKIRNVSETYTSFGVTTFPEGIPFMFWEQYVSLRHYLILAVCVCIVAVFICVTLLLMSPWTSAIIILVISMIIIELAGFMGAIGLKMNAVSAVTLISAVGVSVEFTVQISFRYLTSLGTPNNRIISTMKHMFNPVYHGDVATFLGIIMLGVSNFEFIVKYFFAVMSFLIVLGVINGLALLPVLLTLIGPPSECRPKDGSTVLPLPDLQEHPVPAYSESLTPHQNGSSSVVNVA